MNINDLTVRTRLGMAFGGLAAIVLLVSWLSLHALGDSNQRFARYVEGINARANLVAQVRGAVDRRAIAARNLVLVKSPSELAEEKAEVARAHEEVQTGLTQLTQLSSGDTDASARAASLIAEIARVERAYGPVALAIVELALSQKNEQAIAKMNEECRPLLAALLKATSDFDNYTRAQAQQLVTEGAAQYARQRNLLVLGCVLAFLAAALAGVWITRSLTRSLGAEPGALGLIAQRVTSGDLSPIAHAERAPAGSVLASLAAMQGSLSHIVGQVRSASDSIATGSSEIAAGNADLSQRTEEQASNLQQTAASMEQLTGTVKNTAETAQQANQLASEASAAATQGGRAVDQVVATMQDISGASKRIADIIGVIDGIAFQTNILALNAAVEAARAGEQGRGFAVVASEVRSLAQRSANAAKEIKTLIGDSVEKVEAGSRQVHEAGQSMSAIVGQINHVSRFIEQISRATYEQTSGIGQVGDAVNQLDQVTQQNAALVEESAAAAESLRHQAARMAEMVGFFKLSA
ncbi:methyl-accepting chemotaxis protein [Piscinibacter gummiphilus]|uniref:Methyl-accepting chemotaxis protein n=1 Tax=Piscinibacter gummiphilus TaxID=946333 RepID=A0ABZ0D411_9BURK|nr:methyl-accepting chemotaxis protein [Piscinibacter gummiphilus]WOB09972.1 methyl-accepting chemotaxis protein [Piscinibacter gummiphilus]